MAWWHETQFCKIVRFVDVRAAMPRFCNSTCACLPTCLRCVDARDDIDCAFYTGCDKAICLYRGNSCMRQTKHGTTTVRLIRHVTSACPVLTFTWLVMSTSINGWRDRRGTTIDHWRMLTLIRSLLSVCHKASAAASPASSILSPRRSSFTPHDAEKRITPRPRSMMMISSGGHDFAEAQNYNSRMRMTTCIVIFFGSILS